MGDGREQMDDDSPEYLVGKLRDAFKEEAYELLAELEAALLELEKTPGDRELIGRVFRALHTIKGSGATCEFRDIAAFAHELETFFDLVRKGKLVVSREIIDLTLAARDHIRAMFDGYYRDGGESDPIGGKAILASFRKFLPTHGEEAAPAAGHGVPAAAQPPDAAPTGKDVTYRIRFRQAHDSVSPGADSLHALQELRRLGTCRVVAQTDAMPMRDDLQPDRGYTCWDVILTTSRGTDAIHDAFIFMKDTSDVKVDIIDDSGLECTEATCKKLGEILLERGSVTRDDLLKVLASQKRLGELLVEAEAVAPAQVESALAEQERLRKIREKSRKDEATSTIRVSTEKLDSLVNLVGELVTVQARLSQTVAAKGHSDLVPVSEDVERLTASLRDKTLSIRMLPIGTTFSRFKRLVRDLSTELGKEAELATGGAETELDKTVIERLGDPLVHLIRNCIDHGIERPGARLAAGKPRSGTVRLSAEHSGANVLIRIQDDGAGLDTDAIHAKALERGLVRADAELSERELQALIFAPGFSTVKQVTDVSGRGVGLDVVKKAIDGLRGTIEISSRKGAGTAITLKLPLTLAIIDGLLTMIGAEYFVFPLSLVVECVELTGEDRKKTDSRPLSRHLINVRGEIVPYIRLREQFLIGNEPPAIEQVIIAEANGSRVGFVVDRVLGGYQTVIKNLGKLYRDVKGISGATILGDGTVALIIDVPKLALSAEMDEEAPLPHAFSRGW